MGFAASIKAAVEKEKQRLVGITKKSMVFGAQGVILKSPVGNPEQWAINAHATYGRQTHNLFVDAINADLQPGEKKLQRMGQKKLKKTYKLAAGEGYVGGRFRANWQFGIGGANESTTESADAGGEATKAKLEASIDAASIGGVWYVTNSLPYAKRLEYGWSKQAPGGMVRLTRQEMPDAIRRYAKGAL